MLPMSFPVISSKEKKEYDKISKLEKDLQEAKKKQIELCNDITHYQQQEDIMIKLIDNKNKEITKYKKDLMLAKNEINDYKDAEHRMMTLINNYGNSGKIYELVLPVYYREDGWKTGNYKIPDST